MDLVKKSKDLVSKTGKNLEKGFEKGLEVVKDTFDNLARHLPFVNLAKHSSDTFDIEVDLPGVKKEDIDIEIQDGFLIVNAIRKYKKELSEKDYYLHESSFGRFSRGFALGDNINRDTIKAKYEDGRLYLTFEKIEHKKTKSITVK